MARSEKSERPKRRRTKPRSEHRAIWLIRDICERAGSFDLIPENSDLQRIIAERNTPALFDWLIVQISFQGISDRVAEAHLREHGSITWKQIDRSLAKTPKCPKLENFWKFDRCRYEKNKRTCSRPELFAQCPVPRAPLRNGRLNQSAHSLFLFIRDCADSDLISWIDDRLPRTPVEASNQLLTAAMEIVAALRGIYGVADKLLTMALANLFLAAGPSRPHWKIAGANLVVIDTLVHNWLQRTGLISALGRTHSFGPDCYRNKGCASIIQRLARHIDSSGYNRVYPEYFPRFVQHAIWRFCSLENLSVCNGVKINDRSRCKNRYCILFRRCARRNLHE